MKPIQFKGQTTLVAKDQPQYNTLPAHISSTPGGEVVSCWQLSFRERLILLFTGKIWMQLLMFRDKDGKVNPITPSYLTVTRAEVIPEPDTTPTVEENIEKIKAAIKAIEDSFPKNSLLMAVIPDWMYKAIRDAVQQKQTNELKPDEKIFVYGVMVVKFTAANSFMEVPEWAAKDNVFITEAPKPLS